MVGVISLVTGRAGPSGFGSASTAEQVTQGIDGSNLTAIITGQFLQFHYTYKFSFARRALSIMLRI